MSDLMVFNTICGHKWTCLSNIKAKPSPRGNGFAFNLYGEPTTFNKNLINQVQNQSFFGWFSFVKVF